MALSLMSLHDPNPKLIEYLESKVAEVLAEIEATQPAGIALRDANRRLRDARMRVAHARGTHTQAEWDAIVAECDRNCVRCGRHHPEPLAPVKGHILPVAAGGSDAADNLMPLCRACSSARGNEHIDWLAAYRETHGKPAPAATEGA